MARLSFPLFIVSVALFVGCSAGKEGDSADSYAGTPLDTGSTGTAPETLRLATFNIEWLSVDPLEFDMRRNDVDHGMIADLIEHISPDVMVLEEIEGDGAMNHLDLPSKYSWAAGDTGWSQNVVLLWRNDRVSLTDIDELNLPGSSGANKEPLTAVVTAGELSFTVVGIHHAAFTDADSSRDRLTQAQELVDWTADTLPDLHPGAASDNIVIMGDFNDSFEGLNPAYPSLDAFRSGGFVFATEAADTYSQISYESLIDHIALSPDLAEHWSADDSPGGCHIEAHDITSPWSDYTGGYRNTQNISDHRPVWIDITVPR